MELIRRRSFSLVCGITASVTRRSKVNTGTQQLVRSTRSNANPHQDGTGSPKCYVSTPRYFAEKGCACYRTENMGLDVGRWIAESEVLDISFVFPSVPSGEILISFQGALT